MKKMLAVVFFLALAVPMLFIRHGFAASGSCVATPGGQAVTGYAWSDTVGWIDLSCQNSNVCGSNNFGLTVASDGSVSGCGWSDSVGWVSATGADLAGCPSGSCSSQISPTTGVWSGWLKVVSGGSAQSGGWDGWVSLNGSAPSYGVTVANGTMSGYAWGSDVVGWIDFSSARTAFRCTPTYTCSGSTIQNNCDASQHTTCTSPAFCSPGSSVCLYPSPQAVSSGSLTGHLQVKPSLIAKGATATVYWNISNVQSCTVTAGNGDSWTGLSSGPNGQKTKAITAQTNYVLSCLALDNSTYKESATTNILPVYREK